MCYEMVKVYAKYLPGGAGAVDYSLKYSILKLR